MVEKINLPIKISGDTLSAIEFNQVVDKTNNLITEFNSATTLSQVTWTIGQPKPTIVADEIIGTISEGETKYVQTSTVGNQTVAILHSPNSVLSETVVQSYDMTKLTTRVVLPIAEGYFIMYNEQNDNVDLCYLNNGVIETITLGNELNNAFSVSQVTYHMPSILTDDYLIVIDNNDYLCINVIDRATNTWNEALSVKATAALMTSDTYALSLEYDGASSIYALVETSDNEYVTDFDVSVLKFDLAFNLISTRVISTHLAGSDDHRCNSISVIDGMLYETTSYQIVDNYELICKRYNLTTNSYDSEWGDTIITSLATLGVLTYIVVNGYFKLIKSGSELYYAYTGIGISAVEDLHIVKLVDSGTAVEVVEYPGITSNWSLHDITNIYLLHNNTVVITYVSSNSVSQTAIAFIDGSFVDITENFENLFIAGLSQQSNGYAVFGLLKSDVLTAIANRTFNGDLSPTTIQLTDLNFNPNITVTSVSDYYVKASDYWQAVASPGDIYIPEDVRTSIVSSIMMIDGTVYKYDNETEALIELNVPGASTSYGGYAVNDLVLLEVGELTYTIYGVNDDLSLTDLTTWFTQAELDNIELTQLCYVNSAVYSTTVTYDASGNYIITKRTATETTTLPLTIEMTNASAMTTIQMQKLDSTHIALWNTFVEPPMRMYIVDAILEIGDTVTFTTYTTSVGEQTIYQLSINWMHDYPNIAGVKSDGSLIFPADAVSQAHTDIVTPITALVGEMLWNIHAILDSDDRKIAMFAVGEQYYGFFDADSMTPIMSQPQFDAPVNQRYMGTEVGNILHQKSDGTYIYIRQESKQIFESTDLITWTLITPTNAPN